MRIIAHRDQRRVWYCNWVWIVLAFTAIAGAVIFHVHDDNEAALELLLAAPLAISADKLFQRCANGQVDKAAWEEFFSRYGQDIRAVIYRVLGCPPHGRYYHLFSDAIQQFYLRLLAKDGRVLFSFRGHTEGEAKAFLRKVAASAAVYVRDKMASTGASLQDCFVLGADDFVSRSETIADSSADEDYLLLRQAIEHCLQRVVHGRNKSRNILIFKLAVFDGLSAKEIAANPELNAGSSHAVEQLVSRIRAKVRLCLQR